MVFEDVKCKGVVMNKQTLKSHFVQGIIAVSVVLAVLMPVNAQSDLQVRVTIPFDFMVGLERLPAGDYSLRQHTTAQGVMVIRNKDDGKSLMFMAVFGESLVPRGQARLVFNRYQDQYFLHQIWTTEVNQYELPKSRTERSIEKDLALSGRKTVEIIPIDVSPQ
jgi:hypothetical protein